MLYADSMVRLPNHPVMITDRICMAHGLEARSPFMDHELAQFAARLPAALKVRGGTLRYIQRKLAARYLPPEILNRPKQGFSSALPYLLQAEYARLYRTCLRDFALGAGPHSRSATSSTQLVDEHTHEARRSWQSTVAAHQRRDLVSHGDPRPVEGRSATRARVSEHGTAGAPRELSRNMKTWLRISVTLLLCALLLIYVVDVHSCSRRSAAAIRSGRSSRSRPSARSRPDELQMGTAAGDPRLQRLAGQRLMVYCSAMMWGLALPSTVGADGIRVVLVAPLRRARRRRTRDHPRRARYRLHLGAADRAVIGLVILQVLLADATAYAHHCWSARRRWSPSPRAVLVQPARPCGYRGSCRDRATQHASPDCWADCTRPIVARRRSPTLRLFSVLTFPEQMLMVACYGLVAVALEHGVRQLVLFAAVPLAILVSRLPVSLDGIGVYEGIFIASWRSAACAPRTRLRYRSRRVRCSSSCGCPGGPLDRAHGRRARGRRAQDDRAVKRRIAVPAAGRPSFLSRAQRLRNALHVNALRYRPGALPHPYPCR